VVNKTANEFVAGMWIEVTVRVGVEGITVRKSILFSRSEKNSLINGCRSQSNREQCLNSVMCSCEPKHVTNNLDLTDQLYYVLFCFAISLFQW
jgi:hypothetical protein